MPNHTYSDAPYNFDGLLIKRSLFRRACVRICDVWKQQLQYVRKDYGQYDVEIDHNQRNMQISVALTLLLHYDQLVLLLGHFGDGHVRGRHQLLQILTGDDGGLQVFEVIRYWIERSDWKYFFNFYKVSYVT